MVVFDMIDLSAEFSDAQGKPQRKIQQIRTDPVTLKQCRITPSRAGENERGTEKLYQPPDHDLNESLCPFCPPNIETKTPCLHQQITTGKRLRYNESVLFPNLYPYTEWSAVSLFDATHHVEIGTASPSSYCDSFINCADYLCRVKRADPDAIFMAITQNHLPGAGGSLIHPHLQVHATKRISNNHALLKQRTEDYSPLKGKCLFSDLLAAEQEAEERYIGSTGLWEWTAAFAPSGFYEIWGIAITEFSLLSPEKKEVWQSLAHGIINIQKFYRSLNRNAYNLSLLAIEDERNITCLRVSCCARSSYAPWVRSDFTGFEIASGEMTTFSYPENVAEKAKRFWS